jgi:hypothetical protein
VLVERPNGRVQVGLDPRAGLIFQGQGFVEVLTALRAAPTTPTALNGLGHAAGLSSRQVSWTVNRLIDAGLLLASRTAKGRVRLLGAGPVGLQLARYLATGGVAELFVFDDLPPDSELYPSGAGLADRASALAATLAGATRVVPLTHWSKPESDPVDLTVVVADGPEVDRVITDRLIRYDQPHLLVRSLGDAVWVGPLVLPGQTSCVRCADLTRRDADPEWPVVLAQLDRLRLPVPELLTGWAASVAAAQALAFLAGRIPESAGVTLELTGDLRTEVRHWPAHPECGCGWAARTEWGS